MRTIVKGGATQRRDKKQKELKTTQRKQYQTQMSTNKQEKKKKLDHKEFCGKYSIIT